MGGDRMDVFLLRSSHLMEVVVSLLINLIPCPHFSIFMAEWVRRDSGTWHG